MPKKPPAPFDQLPNTAYNWSKANYWEIACPTIGDGNNMWLFSPEYDCGWPGHGYWRLGTDRQQARIGPPETSAFCATPQELWAHYITFTLTGEL